MREVHGGLVQCSCHLFLFKAGSLWWSGAKSRSFHSVLIVIGHGCKRLDGCDLAVFVLGVMCHFVDCRAWTEQRFPLSSFEVPGFWSYRLAGEAAAIRMVWVQKWRVP
ncbi:hypothetical protein HID58_084603, partial [Brassica napus]